MGTVFCRSGLGPTSLMAGPLRREEKSQFHCHGRAGGVKGQVMAHTEAARKVAGSREAVGVEQGPLIIPIK